MAPQRKKRAPVRPPTPQEELADLDALAAELRELIRVQRRFSPEGVREHRHRLGITAAQYASLLGVSMQMVYGWEEGYARPKPDHLFRWIELLDTEDEVALKPLGLVPVRPVSQAYGELVGVSTQAVFACERGRTRPRPEVLRRGVDAARPKCEDLQAGTGNLAVGRLTPRSCRCSVSTSSALVW